MRTARALAAFEGAETVGLDHLARIAPSALRHRLRRNPLDESGSTARVARAVAEDLLCAPTEPRAMSRALGRRLRVARLVAADPQDCGGVRGPGRGRPGAGRLARPPCAATLPGDGPCAGCPRGIADDRLLGGLDLAATLAAGRPVAQPGSWPRPMAGSSWCRWPSACRPAPPPASPPPSTPARSGWSATGWPRRGPARFGLILLDEGEGDDERVPEALADAWPSASTSTGIAWGETRRRRPTPTRRTRREPDRRSPTPRSPPSARSPPRSASPPCAGRCWPLRVARLLAATAGGALRRRPIREAARLVLGAARDAAAARARRRPTPQPPERPPTSRRAPDECRDPDDRQSRPRGRRALVEAARAAIPPGLLARLAAAGAGARPRRRPARSARRCRAPRAGRPAGTRPGDPRSGRLALIETLRAAAPWQRLRAGADGRAPALIRVRPRGLPHHPVPPAQRDHHDLRRRRLRLGRPGAPRRGQGRRRAAPRRGLYPPRPGRPRGLPRDAGPRSSCRRPARWRGPGAASRPCRGAGARRSPPASTPPATSPAPSAAAGARRWWWCSPTGAPTSPAPGRPAGPQAGADALNAAGASAGRRHPHDPHRHRARGRRRPPAASPRRWARAISRCPTPMPRP